MSTLLKFDKLNNIRDLGGMRSSDGRCVKTGKLIRSGHLVDLTAQDSGKLSELAEVIVDFRTDKERDERPNIQVPGITYIHIPIVESLTPGISREEESDREIIGKMLMNPDAARQYMCNMYRSFTEDSALSQYESFIRILLEDHQRAVIWHCTAGKDRAGIASAIVEKLLDINEDDIISDYLLTNTCLESDIAFLTDRIKTETGIDNPLADESLHFLFCAERDYIDAFYSEISRKFGDFAAFAGDGLGLSNDDIDKFRSMYLE